MEGRRGDRGVQCTTELRSWAFFSIDHGEETTDSGGWLMMKVTFDACVMSGVGCDRHGVD